MQNTKKVSFSGNIHYSIPSDWRLDDNGITDGGGVDTENNANWSYNEPTPEKISQYVKNNPGTFLQFNHAELGMHNMYSYPVKKFAKPSGEVYIGYDGSLTTYPGENSNPAIHLIEGLLGDNRNEEAVELVRNSGININGQNVRNKLIRYYISEGRDEEAIEVFPAKKNYIEDIVDSIKKKYFPAQNYGVQKSVNDALAKGDLLGAMEEGIENLPSPLNKQKREDLELAAKYIQDNHLFEIWVQKHKVDKEIQASGFLDEVEYELRLYFGIFSLGISEVLNVAAKRLNKLSRVNKDIAEERTLINACGLSMLKAREDKIEEGRTSSLTRQKLEKTIEPAKAQISDKLIEPLLALQENELIKIPNCVMLEGDNPYVMQHLIDWAGDITQRTGSANYVKLASKADKAQMQEDILTALETAEKNYQQTNRRSLIFVNGMDKLINSKTNTKEQIAIMKDLMSCANDDYHSTIIFYTRDSKNLDPGTTVSHRVGLKVNVPVKLETKEG